MWSVTTPCANCERELPVTSTSRFGDANTHFSPKTGFYHLDHLKAACTKECAEKVSMTAYKQSCEIRLPGILTYIKRHNATKYANFRLEAYDDYLFAIKYHMNGVSDALQDLVIFQMERKSPSYDAFMKHAGRRKAFLRNVKELDPCKAWELVEALI